MKPLLFLDINGVLNSVLWFRKQKGMTSLLDPKCVRILQRIVNTTNCDIVTMSTWRLFHTRLEIMQSLCDAGYTPPVPIISETPRLPGRRRGLEVRAWLYDTYDNEDSVYCCVDDSADFCAGQRHVQVNNDVGLTNADANEIIAKLLRRP